MRSGANSRRVLALGAVLTVIGLGAAAALPAAGAGDAERTSEEQRIGGMVALLGWATLAWGIHRFGRES